MKEIIVRLSKNVHESQPIKNEAKKIFQSKTTKEISVIANDLLNNCLKHYAGGFFIEIYSIKRFSGFEDYEDKR